MKRIGEHVGRFRLVKHLGAGGMGDVFEAHDERLDRTVAIKAIRPESLSAEVRGRLVREAQLLSSLDHENICRIYELIEEGDEAFLVLEMIRGRDLRQVLEEELPFRQKLELAERVAVALAVAHSRQIIHRDLKLENVMMRADGVVKVLDFGVARSLSARAAGRPRPSTPTTGQPGRRNSSLTRLGQTIGTVLSMSPEQARGETVTASTDLYSLGLLLQELFTGRAPYPEDLEEDVLWLRAKDGDTLPIEGVDGELTALLEDLKSLRPSDRPSAAETVRRLRRIRDRGRRRLRFAAAAAMVTAALFGAVKYTVDLRAERNLAVAAQMEAERRGEEAEAVVDFLVQLFDASDPSKARGHDPKASELLARGDELLDVSLAEQPLVRARLLETVARVRRLLGDVERSEALYLAALDLRNAHQEPGHIDIGRVESALGDLLRYGGRHAASKELLESSLAKLEDLGTEADVERIVVLNRLGVVALETGQFAKAVEFFDRVIESRTRAEGPRDSLVIAARNNAAVAHVQQGNLERAAAEHRQVLEARRQSLGADHPEVATSLNNLAVVSYLQGDLDASEESLLEALAIWRQSFGDEHPEVATAISNLGDLALQRGQLETAAERYGEALAMWRGIFGPDHPDLAYAWLGLGRVSRERGDLERAAENLGEALRLRESAFGAEHPETIEVRQDLGALSTGGEAASASR
ncbi:MAG: serine/threonine-protein kinase [Acidobacteriota bacterium]